MATIDPAEIWTVARHAVFKPGIGYAGTKYIIRKKHNRLSHTEAAKAVRANFAEAARACRASAKGAGEFLACMQKALRGKKYK